MAKNIVLTGFMMAGKTSVGTELSRLTKRVMLDSDEEIVRREEMSINEIFACFGEEYFRAAEAEVIEKLSQKEGIIISTGGGVVLNEKNRENLRKNGIIVNIKITPEIIEARLKNEKSTRPLIKDGELEGVLKRLEARKEAYADCDYVIMASDSRTPKEQAEEIIGILKENGEM